MKLDIIVGVVLSAAIHGGVLFASYLTKKEAVVAAVEEEETVIEIMQMPIIEPDEPDVPPDEAPPEEIEYVPPQQADVPTASIDSAFTQQIQPPPPSMSAAVEGNLGCVGNDAARKAV
jgi:protein TonB